VTRVLKANIFKGNCDAKMEFQTVVGLGGGGICRNMDISGATDYIFTIKCWAGK